MDNPLLKFKLDLSDEGCHGHCAEELSSFGQKALLHTRSSDECLSAQVYEHIPRHVGLGSGTQMCLSGGKAADLLAGVDRNTEELARLFSRGNRSRVGIEAFASGGFILSDGDSNIRMDVPEEWRFVVAVPHAPRRIHGPEEKERLDGVRALSTKEREELRHSREDMKKGLAEKDTRMFGEAVTRLDRITGKAFTPVQGDIYTNPLVKKGLDIACSMGATGGGQSSWGPGFFAVTEDEHTGQKVSLSLSEFLSTNGGGDVYLAGARNIGARLRVLE